MAPPPRFAFGAKPGAAVGRRIRDRIDCGARRRADRFRPCRCERLGAGAAPSEREAFLAGLSSGVKGDDDAIGRARAIREATEQHLRDMAVKRRAESPSIADVDTDRDASTTSEAVALQLAALQQKLLACAASLSEGLVEREREIKLLLLALLCEEHVLLIGPPGTGKSALARRLSGVCRGVYFERLLTRFSVPEELFGPLSMAGFEAGVYRRRTEGYLPDAHVAFVDEIFKANSAILNALLTILNERRFEDGAGAMREVPLRVLVGASNGGPEGPDLAALSDRFLFRRFVQPVSGDGARALLSSLSFSSGSSDGTESARPGQVAHAHAITAEDAAFVRTLAAQVSVPASVVRLLARLRTFLREECEPPVVLSDRRMLRMTHVLRVAALTCGRNQVSRFDCLLLEAMACEEAGPQLTAVRAWLRGALLAKEAGGEEEGEEGGGVGMRMGVGVGVGAGEPAMVEARANKIFRDLCGMHGGKIYVRGDSMSARYTAYRKGKLGEGKGGTGGKGKGGKGGTAAAAAAARERAGLLRRVRALADALSHDLGQASEYLDVDGVCDHLRDHAWLPQGDVEALVCEVEPKMRKAWRFRRRHLADMLAMEAALEGGEGHEVLAALFTDRIETFSTLWRTAL